MSNFLKKLYEEISQFLKDIVCFFRGHDMFFDTCIYCERINTDDYFSEE